MAAKTVLRWFLPKSDPPIVQSVIVETEEELALRNQQRLEQAKQALGGRYVLHPSNQVIRQREERPRTPVVRAPLSDKLRKSKQVIPTEAPRLRAPSADRQRGRSPTRALRSGLAPSGALGPPDL